MQGSRERRSVDLPVPGAPVKRTTFPMIQNYRLRHRGSKPDPSLGGAFRIQRLAFLRGSRCNFKEVANQKSFIWILEAFTATKSSTSDYLSGNRSL
jgi:hypothetical protein